jgi:hypothetical protein
MIGGLIQLATWGFSSGGIGEFLNEMEQQGVFAYLLPFLLIFALVFGILSRMKLFQEKKSVNGIIAFVIGLMVLQFDFVPIFFSELFPRFGVALAILLVVLILAGLFMDPDDKGVMYVMFAVGVIIAIIVLINTAGGLGWSAGNWWYDNWKTVAWIAVLLAGIAIIVGGSNPSKTPSKSLLAQALRGTS